MLILTRKKNQEILIGDEIVITVLETRRDRVRLGFAAPRDVPIRREERLPVFSPDTVWDVTMPIRPAVMLFSMWTVSIGATHAPRDVGPESTTSCGQARCPRPGKTNQRRTSVLPSSRRSRRS